VLTNYLLSFLIWFPIAGGVILLLIGDGGDVKSPQARLMRQSALAFTILTFLASIGLYIGFNNAEPGMQFVERMSWVETFNVWYHLGVDGLSAPLILLTTFITPLVVIAGWDTIKTRAAQYFAAFLIIGIWGGERRIYATLKFFLYTFLGSVLMLVAFIWLYLQADSFNLLVFMNVPIDLQAQKLIFLAFLVAFAVKVPMWPVHTWLPDAHVEAPTGGSVILAAIMLKMGGYGFVRLSLPIVPDGSAYFAGLMIALSLIAVVYIGFVALMQKDMKKLIAYSSIAHMGFVTLGMFLMWSIVADTGAGLGMTGAMVQMISHGLISGAMFLCVGVLYDRVHSRQIADYGGVANTMPVFAAFMVLFAMANAGLPGTSGFVGEFMVIIASFKANFWYAFLAATTLVLGAAYTLWMVKRVVYGAIANDNVAGLEDLNAREFIVLGILAISVLLVGLWPAPLVDMMNTSIEQLIQQVSQSKL
jgi:NADH-quinone oxidoreductase subunit M